MTDLLSAFITYAASGPQEFCVAMGVPGFFVMMFGRPLEKTAKPAPKRQAKTKKRKGAKPGKKARKTRKAKPKASQGETPKWKEFMKAEDYSRESHERINNYHSRRDGIKPGADGWQNIGGSGSVPL